MKKCDNSSNSKSISIGKYTINFYWFKSSKLFGITTRDNPFVIGKIITIGRLHILIRKYEEI